MASFFRRLGRLRAALAISLATEYSLHGIGLVSIIILSRLLTPEEVGVFSLCAALMMIAHELRNFGVGQYIIREESITDDKVRSSIGVMFLISWPLGALLALASGAIARFYGHPGVQSVVLVLSLSFVILPFTGVVRSYLARELQFGAIMRMRMVPELTNAVVVVLLASLGFSYMSMAWATLASSVAAVVMAHVVRPRSLPWMPSLRNLGRVFSFGSLASLVGVLRMVNVGTPEFVIGRSIGFQGLGNFSRAFGLTQMFNRFIIQALRPVILPHFSEQIRSGDSISWPYYRAVSYLTGIGWPFYCTLFIAADKVVLLLFGDQWGMAVPLVRALCAVGFLEALFAYSAEILIASGAISRLLAKEALVLPIKLIAVLAAASQGLVAVCLALVGVAAVELVVVSLLLRRYAHVDPREVLFATWRSVKVTAAFIPALLLVWAVCLERQSPAIAVAGMAISATSLWLAVVLLMKHEVSQEIVSLLRRWRGAYRPPDRV